MTKQPATPFAPKNSAEVEAATTVVVVGNGMVSQRFCEALRKRSAETRIVVFGEEPRPAYDRVQLTKYFGGGGAEALCLGGFEWYAQRDIELHVGERVVSIERDEKHVVLGSGERVAYDQLVLATGSSPFVPPLPGVTAEGVFVYRTIEDLAAIEAYSKGAKRCAVMGGGLLGLEAARAVQQCGVETHVLELAPRLMPRQLDTTGARMLQREIEAMGVHVRTGASTKMVITEPSGDVNDVEVMTGLEIDDEVFPCDMLVISAGIRPRDELARSAEIEVGPRGGICVDNGLRTSDPSVWAIGECALHEGMIYGLVAPGYEMAEVLAERLSGGEASFAGADLSTKLKLLGVDVASFGDAFAEEKDASAKCVAFQDFTEGVYKKLILAGGDEEGDELRVLGGILVGDASAFELLAHHARSGDPLSCTPEAALLGARDGGAQIALPDAAQVCSCNDVSKGAICGAVQGGSHDLATLKSCTGAGTSCGGCLPQVTQLLDTELKQLGISTRRVLCEHFDLTRRELFDIVRVTGITSFEELIERHGQGLGCEVCKPTAASVFASLQNDMILSEHDVLQDTNDRFLANIQRRGLYSVIPRIPGGEIRPDKLIRLGEIAQRYSLYTKITGGQRIDMFGARLNQLPDIWQELVESGFESGHAYAKGLRTVKSCVGTTWCRYGVGDAVGLAIRLEERYRGIRSPHKLKSAVSGCARECAEAQSKDFGIIATENGWNLYVSGNGGATPRHADLLVSDVNEDDLIRYIDRFLMYYICTADKLTRTSVWLEGIEGGLEHVRGVVVDDSLGLCEELERMAQHLVDTYQCEWKAVTEDPKLRAKFRHFANSDEDDDAVFEVVQRGQRRVADWETPAPRRVHLPVVTGAANDDAAQTPETVEVFAGDVEDFPLNGGMSVKHGEVQLAVYRFESQGRWYAAQNMCPHMEDMVLARGMLGDSNGAPKVVCPMHKKGFSLETGECLSGDDYQIMTFPVNVRDGRVYVEAPPSQDLVARIGAHRRECSEAAE